MKNRVTKPILAGGILKFDLQRFATVTPTLQTSIEDALKNGAEINFGINFYDYDSIVNFRNDNGTYTYTNGEGLFIDSGATMILENNKLILTVYPMISYDEESVTPDYSEWYTITLDAQANGSYTVSMSDYVSLYTEGNLYIQSLQINGTSLPILADKVIGSVYNITLNGKTLNWLTAKLHSTAQNTISAAILQA